LKDVRSPHVVSSWRHYRT